jgi:ferric-dicitrate binding protein FerR (iron transport regulator)
MKKDTKHNVEKRIFKVLNGNIGTDELIQFRNWLNANPENKVLFQKYKSTWELTGNYLENNKDWTKIAAKINSSYSIPSYITTVNKLHKILYIRNWQKIAAAILLIFALGSVVGIHLSDRQNIQLSAVEQVKSNLLPDGSRVILNQG